MARLPKLTLEDQMKKALEKVALKEKELNDAKSEVAEIQKKIDERDMRDALSLLRDNGLSINQLEDLINKNKK